MAKFHGKIGIVSSVETAPGVHQEVATEVSVNGDIIREARRFEKGDTLNENLSLSNRFSIVYNDVTLRDFQYIKYVKYLDVLWKVTNIEIQLPRIILTVGGVYNGITI